MPRDFSLFLAASLHPPYSPEASIDTIVCASVRASVKFNTCPPMSEECETCPSAGPGPGSKGGRVGGEGTEAPGCTQLPPSLRLMCSPRPQAPLGVCTSRCGKWSGALNAPQECPSKEPCGEVFCKVKKSFCKVDNCTLFVAFRGSECSEVLGKEGFV